MTVSFNLCPVPLVAFGLFCVCPDDGVRVWVGLGEVSNFHFVRRLHKIGIFKQKEQFNAKFC